MACNVQEATDQQLFGEVLRRTPPGNASCALASLLHGLLLSPRLLVTGTVGQTVRECTGRLDGHALRVELMRDWPTVFHQPWTEAQRDLTDEIAGKAHAGGAVVCGLPRGQGNTSIATFGALWATRVAPGDESRVCALVGPDRNVHTLGVVESFKWAVPKPYFSKEYAGSVICWPDPNRSAQVAIVAGERGLHALLRAMLPGRPHLTILDLL